MTLSVSGCRRILLVYWLLVDPVVCSKPSLPVAATTFLSRQPRAATVPTALETVPDIAYAASRRGSCWLKVESTGRCSSLYAVNVTRAECCAFRPGGGGINTATISHATGWSPHVSLTSRQYFYWIVVGQGAPDCQPCRTSCDGFQCGSGVKVCRVRQGQPRCVCPTDCGATSGGGNVGRWEANGQGPVCAFDGRTYRNQCQLTRHNCRLGREYHVDYFGTCQSSCASVICSSGKHCIQDQNGVPHCIQCVRDCPRTGPSDRVCGSDGRNYPSLCALERDACETGRPVRLAYAGDCRPGVSCSRLRCPNGERCVVDESSRTPVCLACDRPCLVEVTGRRMVCGSDGVTYSSYCDMLHAACSRRVFLLARHAGECDGGRELTGSTYDYVDEAVAGTDLVD